MTGVERAFALCILVVLVLAGGMATTSAVVAIAGVVVLLGLSAIVLAPFAGIALVVWLLARAMVVGAWRMTLRSCR